MQEPEEGQTQDQAREARTKPFFSGATAAPHWGLATLLAFRLVFAYEILYSFPFPLNLLPWSDKIGWYSELFGKMTIWTGAHILHLHAPLAYSFYAGGDSMFGWVENLVKLMLAVGAATIWSLLDRKRHNYRSMQEWLWLYVRLVLGTAMISYG